MPNYARFPVRSREELGQFSGGRNVYLLARIQEAQDYNRERFRVLWEQGREEEVIESGEVE